MKKGNKTREAILKAGLELWKINPSLISAVNIAKKIGKTHPTVYHHFKSEEHLQKAVALYGVQKDDSIVIVSLMLTGNPLVSKLCEDERQKHLNAVKEFNLPKN